MLTLSPPSLLAAAGYYHQVPKRRYRQGRVRAEISLLENEICSLENLIDSGTLSEMEMLNVEKKCRIKTAELTEMRKELDRLISGQMRQRKFREKLKKRHTQDLAGSPASLI